ncbi:IclR family transcriptional regulator domain-containing protein, partial [Bowmanella yangjiangensis]
ELEALLTQQGLDASQHTALREELEQIRACGYSTSLGEIDEGVWGVSAALLDSRGRLHGALSLMGPASRVQPRAEQLQRWTLESAARVSARLD